MRVSLLDANPLYYEEEKPNKYKAAGSTTKPINPTKGEWPFRRHFGRKTLPTPPIYHLRIPLAINGFEWISTKVVAVKEKVAPSRRAICDIRGAMTSL